jgi:hypothetical protein
VPNSSFESWDSTAGYLVPVGWDNLNPETHTSPQNTCQRIAPGYIGNYYLALNSENIPGMGIVPGVAVCGKLDPVTYMPVSGFPFSSRPQVLAGMWQYMPYTTMDNGHVAVLLSKWNTVTLARDTVAFSSYTLPGMVMSWQQFQIGISYNDTAMPDSAMIYLSASSGTPVAYSFLWIDELQFRDSISLTTSTKILSPEQQTSLFPNPVTEQLTIVYPHAPQTEIQLSITDVCGRIVRSSFYTANYAEDKITVNTKYLVKGVYFVKIADKSGSHQLKFQVE